MYDRFDFLNKYDMDELRLIPKSRRRVVLFDAENGSLALMKWSDIFFPYNSIALLCTADDADDTSNYSLIPRSPSKTQGEHRRGRGKRRNEAYWMDYNSRDDTVRFLGLRMWIFS